MESPERPERPLLSICVPTYNRAAWLRASLAYSAPQAEQYRGAVELIVSDNASTDDTGQVVAAYGDLVRYHRNDTNLGVTGNFQTAVNLACGEYVWMLGDDDFMLPGALERLLPVLSSDVWQPLIYLNNRGFDARQPPESGAMPLDILTGAKPESDDLHDRAVESISDLLPVAPNCFTGVYSLVLRREHMISAMSMAGDTPAWVSAESTVPHALYIIRELMDQAAYYVGDPIVAVSHDISWSRHWPVFCCVYLPQLFRELEQKGAARSIINTRRSETLYWIETGGLLDRLRKSADWIGFRQFLRDFWPAASETRRLVRVVARVARESAKRRLYAFPVTRFLVHRLYVRQEQRQQKRSAAG